LAPFLALARETACRISLGAARVLAEVRIKLLLRRTEASGLEMETSARDAGRL